jgi:ketosteroid isomerase-like protein
MSKLYTALLLASLSGCGSADIEQPRPPPVDARFYQPTSAHVAGPQKSYVERVRENADAFGRALSDGDLKAHTALFDADVDASFPGMSSTTEINGTLPALTELFEGFTSREYAPSRIWQIEDAVVVDWTMTGVHTGSWMGVSATQKPVAIRGATLLWFDPKGLILDVHVYFDCGAVLAQLGAAPNPTVTTGPAPVLAASPALTVASGTPEEKASIAIVNTSWDATEVRNEAVYIAPFTDDVEVTRFDRSNVDHGKDERKKFFRWLTTGMSSIAQDPLNTWVAANFVIQEYTIGGVHSGKLIPTPPTGHALRLHYLDIYEMQSGKIARAWTYGNSLEMYAQAGVIPRASPGTPAAVTEFSATAAAAAHRAP